MNFGESAKPRGLRGNMGYVGAWVAWVTWVKILFYVVHDFCVGCVGQICFCVGLCLCQNILRGSSFFRGSAFTYQMRLFYYTNSLGIFLRESLPSKSWPNPVFLRGLLEICKIDNTQWHFYERVTKFYLWAANWPYSQRGCDYSQTSCSSQTPQASFENSIHLWKLFDRKNFPKECCIMP